MILDVIFAQEVMGFVVSLESTLEVLSQCIVYSEDGSKAVDLLCPGLTLVALQEIGLAFRIFTSSKQQPLLSSLGCIPIFK